MIGGGGGDLGRYESKWFIVADMEAPSCLEEVLEEGRGGRAGVGGKRS